MPDDYGWNQLLPDPVRVHEIKASHFSIIDKGPAREVANAINPSATRLPNPISLN